MSNQQTANNLSWGHLATLHFSALLDALITVGGLAMAAIMFYWITELPEQTTGQFAIRTVALLSVLIPAVVTLVEVSKRTRVICVACYAVFVLAFSWKSIASGDAAHLIPNKFEAFFAVLLVAAYVELALFQKVLAAPQGTASRKPEFSWMDLGATVLMRLLVQPILCLFLSLSVAVMVQLFYPPDGVRELDRWLVLSGTIAITFWLMSAAALIVHVLALLRFSSCDPKAIVSRSPNPILFIVWVAGCGSIMVTPLINAFLGSTTVGFFIVLGLVVLIAVYIARKLYRSFCVKRDYRNEALRPLNKIILWGFEGADVAGL